MQEATVAVDIGGKISVVESSGERISLHWKRSLIQGPVAYIGWGLRRQNVHDTKL